MDKSIHTAERIKMKSAIKIAFVTLAALAFWSGSAIDETINIYADLNNDGKIDQAEAQHALQWAAGQRTGQ
jgi:nitrogen fixation protein FixH